MFFSVLLNEITHKQHRRDVNMKLIHSFKPSHDFTVISRDTELSPLKCPISETIFLLYDLFTSYGSVMWWFGKLVCFARGGGSQHRRLPCLVSGEIDSFYSKLYINWNVFFSCPEQLQKSSCWSVGWSVRPLVRRSVMFVKK